jgi:MazG family protein
MPHPIPTDTDGLLRLQKIVHQLRAPGGCPWDVEQTHTSLRTNLIEEAYEVLEAIDSGDRAHLCEELGDLLLQVVLHGEIAAETAAFDLQAIAHGISEKLIRRHPHVYGESSVDTTDGVLRQWDEIKRAEKGGGPEQYLASVGRGMSALQRAAKIQKKVAKVGFDWPDTRGISDKIREELAETEAALTEGTAAEVAEEIGDLLFSVVNLARKLGHDPEVLLAATNEKFIQRFHVMEATLATAATSLGDATLDEMEAAWQGAKAPEKFPKTT